MKKSIIIIASLGLLFSCAKESIINNNQFAISASLEHHYDATKTSLSNYNVCWTEGDKISAFNQNSENIMFSLVGSGGSSTGEFSGPEGTYSYAVFPYSAEASISGSVITVPMPQSQSYVSSSFSTSANIAVSAVNGTKINFKNVCGILKLQLRGTGSVSKIEIIDKNGDSLWGNLQIDMSKDFDGEDYFTLINTEASRSTVELICDSPVQLNATQSTMFYIVVPKGAFSSGLIVKVYSDDFCRFTQLSASSANDIHRNVIHQMPVASIVEPVLIESGIVETNVGTNIGNWYVWSNNGETPYTLSFKANTGDEGKSMRQYHQVTASGALGPESRPWVDYATSVEVIDMGDLCFNHAAFRDFTAVKSVKVSEYQNDMSYYSFYNCTNLESINFPASLTNINQCAFCRTALKEADLSNCPNITYIQSEAFAYAPLTTFTYPSGVVRIETSTLSQCIKLTCLTLNEGLTNIPNCSFEQTKVKTAQ